MSLPGFTAEASLYQTSDRYQQQSIGNIRSDTGVVLAQLGVRDCVCLYIGGQWQCFCEPGLDFGPFPRKRILGSVPDPWLFAGPVPDPWLL